MMRTNTEVPQYVIVSILLLFCLGSVLKLDQSVTHIKQKFLCVFWYLRFYIWERFWTQWWKAALPDVVTLHLRTGIKAMPRSIALLSLLGVGEIAGINTAVGPGCHLAESHRHDIFHFFYEVIYLRTLFQDIINAVQNDCAYVISRVFWKYWKGVL